MWIYTSNSKIIRAEGFFGEQVTKGGSVQKVSLLVALVRKGLRSICAEAWLGWELHLMQLEGAVIWRLC